MISFTTLGAFREAAKVTQERLIKEDLVTVRGKEVTVLQKKVTVLQKIQRRSSWILVLFGFVGCVAVDVAFRSSIGSAAFQIFCWIGTLMAIALQIWRAWVEMRYRARMAWVAGCDVMWRRTMWAPQMAGNALENETENEGGNAGRFARKESAPEKQSVKNLMKQELRSFFSRRHIAGYARLGKFPLLWLLIATGVTVYCALFLHMWDIWPPLNRSFFACMFCFVVAAVSLINALEKWLEDMVVCAVFALTPAVNKD